MDGLLGFVGLEVRKNRSMNVAAEKEDSAEVHPNEESLLRRGGMNHEILQLVMMTMDDETVLELCFTVLVRLHVLERAVGQDH